MVSPFLAAEASLDRHATPAADHERSTGGPQILVVGAKDAPVTDGGYAFHRGDIVERGKLGTSGLAPFSKIDPTRPFVFEVRDRVCAIRSGAFLNPDDPRIKYRWDVGRLDAGAG